MDKNLESWKAKFTVCTNITQRLCHVANSQTTTFKMYRTEVRRVLNIVSHHKFTAAGVACNITHKQNEYNWEHEN